MPLRIAFLSLTHRYDDTRVLVKEAATLAAGGHDVVHIAPDRGASAPGMVHGVRIRLYPSGKGPLGRLFRAGRLWREARRERADVYHCNEVESWLVGLGLKLFRPGAIVVFDVHEHYPSRFAEPRFPSWLQWFGRPLMHLLYRVLPPWTDHVIYAKRSVARDFPPGTRATLVLNYAPLGFTAMSRETVPPAVRAEIGEGPWAVHLGGLSRSRGWPQLLQALALMRHAELRVLALGEIEDGEENFWQEARRLQVSDRIRLHSRVPYQSLFEYLACCEVGLMLYQPGILNHVYAFPMKMYDYMRAGLPVIGPAFAIEVEPVVTAERCGWLIDTADSADLARALDAVCDDLPAARESGARGQAAVIREFNWEREATKLVQLYSGFEQRLLRESSRVRK